MPVLSCCSHVHLFVILWACQAFLSARFSRQEYQNGLPFPSPGDLPDPGIEPASHVSCIGRRVLYHYCKFLNYLLKATCLSAKTHRLSHRTSDSEPMLCNILQIIWNKELNQQINKLVNKNKFKNYYLISLKSKKQLHISFQLDKIQMS